MRIIIDVLEKNARIKKRFLERFAEFKESSIWMIHNQDKVEKDIGGGRTKVY